MSATKKMTLADELRDFSKRAYRIDMLKLGSRDRSKELVLANLLRDMNAKAGAIHRAAAALEAAKADHDASVERETQMVGALRVCIVALEEEDAARKPVDRRHEMRLKYARSAIRAALSVGSAS